MHLPYQDGRVYLTAIKNAPDFHKLLPHTLIGLVESLTEADQLPALTETPPSDPRDVSSQGTMEGRVLSIAEQPVATLSDKAQQQKRALLDRQLCISRDGHTEEEVAVLKECPLKACDVFAVGPEQGRVDPNLVEHTINTGDHPRIKQASRRVPFAVRGEVSKMVNNMLANDIIRESNTP